jgi:hypothetical protein
MTLYTDIDALRGAAVAQPNPAGAWTASRQLAAIDFEDSQRQHRAKLEAERDAKVARLQAQLFRSHLSRLHAGCPDEGDVLGMTHLPFSAEHEARIAAALRRGFRSFAFAQLRIALRMLRDDYRDQADSQTPEVTYEPRRVRLGDEIREAHRTFRITGENL